MDNYYKQIINNRLKGFYENPPLDIIGQTGMIKISKEEYDKLMERFSEAEID